MRLLSNRLVQILLLIVVLLAALLVGTPLLIKHYAVNWLEENGGEQVSFDDVDLNPFTGELALEGLHIRVDDDTTLSFESATADLAWLPLWHKQIEIEAVTLSDLQVVIHQLPDRTLIGGIHLPEAGEEAPPEPAAENPWTAGIDILALNNIRVRYLDDRLDLSLVLEQLELRDLAQWSDETPTPVSASGSLNGAPFELEGEITPLAAVPHYALDLALDSLQLSAFERLLQGSVAKLAGAVSYEGTLDYRQPDTGFEFRQAGGLRLQQLAAAVDRPPVAVTGGDIRIDSESVVADAGGGLQLDIDTDLRLQDLQVTADEAALLLLSGTGLELEDLKITGVDRMSVQRVAAKGMAFARRPETTRQPGAVDIEQLDIDRLSLADNLLSIDSVVIDGLHRQFHRDSEGNLAVSSILDDIGKLTAGEESGGDEPVPDSADADSGADEEASEPGDSEPAAPPMAIAIGRVEVGGDSAVALLDESVEPAFQATLDIKELSLKSLDSRQPEQDTAVSLDAGIGEYTGITLQGGARPFLQPPRVDIESEITALELPPLSPYAVDALGLELDSGTLNSDIRLRSDEKDIDGLVNLKLHQLELQTVESENSLQSQLPVPVNVALDTLRDKNNTIELKIPIKGDPENPSFNINDALTKALASGVQKGALTYLTLALQPYGAMITAAKYAGEAIAKVRLNPVEFAAGGSELDATDTDYLSKVAKVLEERPQLAVKVCGVATAQDRTNLQEQAIARQKQSGEKNGKDKEKNKDKSQPPAPPQISDEQLRTLAKARADAVRSHLVKTHKIEAGRLAACQPRIESGDSDQATPRTDLLL